MKTNVNETKPRNLPLLSLGYDRTCVSSTLLSFLPNHSPPNVLDRSSCWYGDVDMRMWAGVSDSPLSLHFFS